MKLIHVIISTRSSSKVALFKSRTKTVPLVGALNRKRREVTRLTKEIKLQFSNPAAKITKDF